MISYRPARRDDVATIQQFLLELAASLGESDFYQSSQEALLQHGFGPDPCFEALLAFQGDQPAGLCLYFREFSTYRGQPGVYVQDLYVDAERRGQSVGKSLLHEVAKRTSEHWNCRYLRLSVHDHNHHAQLFYQQLGLTTDNNTAIMRLDGAEFQQLAQTP